MNKRHEQTTSIGAHKLENKCMKKVAILVS